MKNQTDVRVGLLYLKHRARAKPAERDASGDRMSKKIADVIAATCLLPCTQLTKLKSNRAFDFDQRTQRPPLLVF